MKLFAFFAASASAMSVGSDRPCDAKIEECLRVSRKFIIKSLIWKLQEKQSGRMVEFV